MISHPQKILFPKDRITKEDLVKYYLKVAKRILPLIHNRPISMHKFPQGIEKKGFFQKKAPKGAPCSVQVLRKQGSSLSMLLCQNAKTLAYLADQNCITPHIWLSTYLHPTCPDRMVFDLDPPTKHRFSTVVKGALFLREILEKEMGLLAFVMTTGSKGLHVVVPLEGKDSFEKVRAFAVHIGKKLVEKYPEDFTLEIRKKKREGKVYIDTLRNGFAQTTVAPYATRPLPHAPVATPLFWEELKNKKLRSDTYTLRTISSRLRRKDPWAGMLGKVKVSLPSFEKKAKEP